MTMILVVGRKKLTTLLGDEYSTVSTAVAADLQRCRRLVLTMDGWSKRGLNGSYLAISASFFHPTSHKPVHVLLNLHAISHPHTGDMIADKILLTLKKWNIEDSKVLTIITDNGSNMVKAIKTLRTNLQMVRQTRVAEGDRDEVVSESEVELETQSSEDSDGDNDSSSEYNPDSDDPTDYDGTTEQQSLGEGVTAASTDVSDDDNDMGIPIPDSVTINRMPCLAHTLLLVLKSFDKMRNIQNVLAKSRKLVKMIKTSSKATELLVSKCGVTLITDCTTRWNSCFMMLDRLLGLKVAVKEVLEELKLDCPLFQNDWQTIEHMVYILRPFKEQTDILQSNTMSMSQIIPSLLELKLFLKDPTLIKSFAQALSQSLTVRFSCFLDPDSPDFNPIPCVSCLLDPNVALCMLRDDTVGLLNAAKKYIRQTVRNLCYNNG